MYRLAIYWIMIYYYIVYIRFKAICRDNQIYFVSSFMIYHYHIQYRSIIDIVYIISQSWYLWIYLYYLYYYIRYIVNFSGHIPWSFLSYFKQVMSISLSIFQITYFLLYNKINHNCFICRKRNPNLIRKKLKICPIKHGCKDEKESL